MSRGGFRRSALIVLVACTTSLLAPRARAADDVDDNPQPKWRTVARWFGSFTQDTEVTGSGGAGVFGMSLSSPSYKQTAGGNVAFDGFNSILINTFILQAPHLNQNRHKMEITARVPARRLLAARPALAPEAAVRARLGVAAEGEVPQWTTVKVPVEGLVACFPSSVTMTLAGMGFINVPSGADQSDEIQKLAQGIYDFYSTKYAKNAQGERGMPEIFPFPESPVMIDALERDAATATAAAATTQPVPVVVRAMQEPLRRALRAQYNNWPFVDGDDDTMKWLISLRTTKTVSGWYGTLQLDTENMRPWQWAWIVGGYVEQTYGNNAEWYTSDAREHPEWANILAADPKKVVHVLGRGCGGVGSIRHISNLGEGGHLIALQGVVVDSSGGIVRHIFHDPYGDQSRNPTVAGYYEITNWDVSKYDRDPPARADLLNHRGEHWGRYVPYGPDINSFRGTLVTKMWEVFEPKTPETPETMKKRLLPSVSSATASD